MGSTISRTLLRFVFLLIILAAILFAVIQSSWFQKKIYLLRYEENIFRYSSQYGLDPHLVMAVIWVESKFEPKARSAKDARGLMQIMPSTGQWIAKEIDIEAYSDESLYDPDINIRMGCWYLSYLLSFFEGDIDLTLAAYNGGMGNVMKWLNDERYSKDGTKLDFIPFEETRQYVGKVIKTYKQYKRLYEL